MEDSYDHLDPHLIYIPTNIPGKGCNLALFDTEPCEGCICIDEQISCCDPASNCSCLKASGRTPNYDLSGRLVIKSGSMIECRSSCRCHVSSCLNRVVQNGPIRGLDIRKTGEIKGSASMGSVFSDEQ